MAVAVREIDEQLLIRAGKELVRLVIIGSVDDGKSTLIGRLLYETGALYEDQVAQVRRASKNGDPIDFSLFTDGLKAEREQGITIDVAYRYLETARRKFILADTPGHAQYTRNMATGASTADAAIILIDARLGVLPQTRRHAAIAALLGIQRVAVAVNKMDLVGFDQDVFRQHARALEQFAAPLGFAQLSFIPVSARLGDNIAAASPRTPWHQGGTVLGFLESVEARGDVADGPFRFPVQTVIRPHSDYRGLAGQIASGTVSVGDEVVVLPSGKRSSIRGIDSFDGPLSQAYAPMSVVLRLADEVDVSRGDLIAHLRSAPTPRSRVEGTVVWLSERPLDPRRAYLLKHTTRTVPAQSVAVRARVDPESLAEQPADSLALNEIGHVVIRCGRSVVADSYADGRATGAFILIDSLTNETAAAGTVGEAAEAGDDVRAGARKIVIVEGDVLRAHEVERFLSERGAVVAVVRTLAAARACAAAGVAAVLTGQLADDPLPDDAVAIDPGADGWREAVEAAVQPRD